MANNGQAGADRSVKITLSVSEHIARGLDLLAKKMGCGKSEVIKILVRDFGEAAIRKEQRIGQ